MTTINLKDFYPWYTHDEYIEVSEEVAEELHTSKRWNDTIKPYTQGDIMKPRKGVVDGTEIHGRI